MIERVAAAIKKMADYDGDSAFGGSPEVSNWSAVARAAIEAMREPTAPMYIAGSEANHTTMDNDGDGDGGGMVAAWRAMIDAALEEK